ncbi:MAG: hypothetical protein U1F36_08740 [Planctomycetota bacterium]
MAARILSTLIFWIVMTVVILGSIVLVLCVYLPFIVIGKALWLKLTGRLDRSLGHNEGQRAGQSIGAHPGL